MITVGEGKYRVWLIEEMLDEDRLYILGGGEKPHIGGVVLMEPGKKIQMIELRGHYDNLVLEPIAKAAVKKYKTKIVAVGGVHIDNATKEEIDILVKNCKELAKCI
jgi:hypothetical protein